MFDPAVGRWFEEDPIGFDTNDPNLYRYVKNGPSNYSDPSGLAPEVAPEPRVAVPRAEWGVGPAVGYKRNAWMAGKDDGRGWWLMIPQASVANLRDSKVGYAFNLVVRPPEVKGKQNIFLNKIHELGIFDASNPVLGPIITSDKAGAMPAGATGDLIYSVDVGGDLDAEGKARLYKLDLVQRGANRDRPVLINPTDAKYPILKQFAAGNDPSGKLFPDPRTDITGRPCAETETAAKSENADWIVWVQRVTKTFGFVNEIKVSKTGQYFISKGAYEQFAGEISANLNSKANPAPAVTMQYTYIFVNPAKTANLPQATQNAFLVRLASELEVPASDIGVLKGLLGKNPAKGPAPEMILLDNPRDPKSPLRLQP